MSNTSNVQNFLTDNSTEIGHLPLDVFIGLPTQVTTGETALYNLSSNIDCNLCVVLAACFVYDGVQGGPNGRHQSVCYKLRHPTLL